MKRKSKLFMLLALVLIINIAGVEIPYIDKEAVKSASAASFVQKHGQLSVKGTNIVDKHGKKVILKGVSSHGINWDVGFPYVNEKAFKTIRDNWGVNTVRLAMYTQDYNGYCVTDAAGRKKLLGIIDTGVKAAKKLGMYVIIDWHVLNDKTPKKYEKKALVFFKTVCSKYKKYDNVLYEICNEPNGDTKWSDIKSYAVKVIKVIRKYNKKSIVIVGTPTWSQDVDIAAKSPIKGYSNIMYSIHFYSATHKDWNMKKLKTAHAKKLPVICTEFGTCDASGNGAYDFKSADKWIKLMKSYNMGYVCWSLSNKAESTSLLKPNCKKTYGFKSSDLTEQGKWLVKTYKK